MGPNAGMAKRQEDGDLPESLTGLRLENPVIIHNYPPMKSGTECSETSAYKIQTPGNYPEESIRPVLV